LRKNLPIDQIVMDDRLQPRMTLDNNAIEEYAGVLEEHDAWPFPPLTVYMVPEPAGSVLYLIDGWHRLMAARHVGYEAVPCEVNSGNFSAAFVASLGVNATHGVRRSNRDKRFCVARALRDEQLGQESHRTIAQWCQVSHTLVSKIHAEMSERDAGPETTRADATARMTHEADYGQPAAEPEDESNPPPSAIRSQVIRSSQPVVTAIRHHLQASRNEIDRMAATHAALESLMANDWANDLTEQRCFTDIDRMMTGFKDVITAGRSLLTKIAACAPHARCESCNGSGCDVCGNKGWITRIQAGLDDELDSKS